jgi:hypothetical protein
MAGRFRVRPGKGSVLIDFSGLIPMGCTYAFTLREAEELIVEIKAAIRGAAVEKRTFDVGDFD